MDEDVEMPEGVDLFDPEDTGKMRDAIFGGVRDSVQRYVHGHEYGGVRLELEGLHLADKERYTLREQHEAKADDKTLARRLRGTVKLMDAQTNEELDRKPNVTLARIPYLTERGTMIHNGSEYSPIMQSRLLPGAYARQRESGESEVHFNTRPGTGSAMRVSMDPQTGVFRLRAGTSNVHAYSFFKAMGVTDEELERRWGKDLLELNKAKTDSRAINRVYDKLIPKWERDPQAATEDKVTAVRDALGRAQVSAAVLRDNLPNLFDARKAASMRSLNKAWEHRERQEKAASDMFFSPDFTPARMVELFLEYDTESLDMAKDASFDPDLEPDDMKDSFNSLYAGVGPRLASMKSWPEHWRDGQDEMGWLQWYENYHAGRRSPTDEHHIGRWNRVRRREGRMFKRDPTVRRAFVLRNWAIDPLRLLPEHAREEFGKEMDRYQTKELARWAVRRHDFTPHTLMRLVGVARERGAGDVDMDDPKMTLVNLVEDGYLTASDFS